MQIGVMNHPARNPLEEIEWIGRHGFDFVDFTLELPAADPDQIDTDKIRVLLDRQATSRRPVVDQGARTYSPAGIAGTEGAA
jgi:hypothetical protein